MTLEMCLGADLLLDYGVAGLGEQSTLCGVPAAVPGFHHHQGEAVPLAWQQCRGDAGKEDVAA